VLQSSLQEIAISMIVEWVRLRNAHGQLYSWGDRKASNVDSNWSKANVVYRWRKNSTGETAIVGETDRPLGDRVNNYTSAKPGGSAGPTNRRVYDEEQRLESKDNFLFLEFTENVPGYDLKNDRQRRFVESLLIGVSRPYLQ